MSKFRVTSLLGGGALFSLKNPKVYRGLKLECGSYFAQFFQSRARFILGWVLL